MTASHVPVLAGELIEALDPQPGQVAIDCTFGAGGHARLIAERLGPTGTLIAIDRDPVAESHFDALAAEVSCTTRFVHASFADGLRELLAEGIRADLVYVDLGISSMQVDTWERGFSYSYDAPLDMRMDTEQELDARTVLNTWEVRRIAQLLREYGDERYASQIARAIGRVREEQEIETTSQLVDIINNAIPVKARFAGGHPAKRSFQAIRIAVNDELGQVDAALPLAWEILRPNGRFAGISFHSGEDRRVKRFLAARAEGCTCPPQLPVCVCGRTPEAELIGRGIAPSTGEIASNPRSASARMRAARKLREEEDAA
ncbi:MAG TPA: 16S rRNA (cytosine(1402)-N(4))-methyltransferase RsmH [Baekduia sp.]|nr:16S rRNA (cytosine(1402)-N(4))-methyltransferase RsmH [Baekduia sp.]